MPTVMQSEIDALRRMTTDELAERYEELHNQPVRSMLSLSLAEHDRATVVPGDQVALEDGEGVDVIEIL